jgi:mono/diheme cytochrome c family protein
MAVLYRLWNGDLVMTKTLRFSSLFMLLAFGAACGGGGDAPAAEDAQQPAAEAPAEAAPAMDLDFPEGVTAEMVVAGEAVFTGAGICYTCHMPGGVGGPLAPNLTDSEWINTDGTYDGIVQTVTTGVSEPQQHPGLMLPKGGSAISDAEVQAVSAYVWSLSQGS